jgi:hypothetical protein
MAPSQSPGETHQLRTTFSGLAWKAMLMRFTVSLQQRYEKVLNFKTYASPAFYAKHVLKAGATKRYGLQTKCSVCLSVSPCAFAKTYVFFLRSVVTSKHEKVKAFFK